MTPCRHGQLYCPSQLYRHSRLGRLRVCAFTVCYQSLCASFSSPSPSTTPSHTPQLLTLMEIIIRGARVEMSPSGPTRRQQPRQVASGAQRAAGGDAVEGQAATGAATTAQPAQAQAVAVGGDTAGTGAGVAAAGAAQQAGETAAGGESTAVATAAEDTSGAAEMAGGTLPAPAPAPVIAAAAAPSQADVASGAGEPSRDVEMQEGSLEAAGGAGPAAAQGTTAAAGAAAAGSAPGSSAAAAAAAAGADDLTDKGKGDEGKKEAGKRQGSKEEDEVAILRKLPPQLICTLPRLLACDGLAESAYTRATSIMSLITSVAPTQRPVFLSDLQAAAIEMSQTAIGELRDIVQEARDAAQLSSAIATPALANARAPTGSCWHCDNHCCCLCCCCSCLCCCSCCCCCCCPCCCSCSCCCYFLLPLLLLLLLLMVVVLFAPMLMLSAIKLTHPHSSRLLSSSQIMLVLVPVTNAATVAAGNEAEAATGPSMGREHQEEVLSGEGASCGTQAGTDGRGSGSGGVTGTKMAGATLLRLLRAFTSLLMSSLSEVRAGQGRAGQGRAGQGRAGQHAAIRSTFLF